MPCNGGNWGYYRGSVDSEEKKIDLLTRIICDLISKVGEEHLTVEGKRWWKAHQKWDRERLAEEERERDEREAKKKALNKLTPAERKLLRI